MEDPSTSCVICLDPTIHPQHHCPTCVPLAWSICDECEERLFDSSCPICRAPYARAPREWEEELQRQASSGTPTIRLELQIAPSKIALKECADQFPELGNLTIAVASSPEKEGVFDDSFESESEDARTPGFSLKVPGLFFPRLRRLELVGVGSVQSLRFDSSNTPSLEELIIQNLKGRCGPLALELPALKTVRVLNVRVHNQPSGAFGLGLTRCPRLKTFHASHLTGLGDENFVASTSLHSLHLVNSLGLEHLEFLACPSLRDLNLRGCQHLDRLQIHDGLVVPQGIAQTVSSTDSHPRRGLESASAIVGRLSGRLLEAKREVRDLVRAEELAWECGARGGRQARLLGWPTADDGRLDFGPDGSYGRCLDRYLDALSGSLYGAARMRIVSEEISEFLGASSVDHIGVLAARAIVPIANEQDRSEGQDRSAPPATGQVDCMASTESFEGPSASSGMPKAQDSLNEAFRARRRVSREELCEGGVVRRREKRFVDGERSDSADSGMASRKSGEGRPVLTVNIQGTALDAASIHHVLSNPCVIVSPVDGKAVGPSASAPEEAVGTARQSSQTSLDLSLPPWLMDNSRVESLVGRPLGATSDPLSGGGSPIDASHRSSGRGLGTVAVLIAAVLTSQAMLPLLDEPMVEAMQSALCAVLLLLVVTVGAIAAACSAADAVEAAHLARGTVSSEARTQAAVDPGASPLEGPAETSAAATALYEVVGPLATAALSLATWADHYCALALTPRPSVLIDVGVGLLLSSGAVSGHSLYQFGFFTLRDFILRTACSILGVAGAVTASVGMCRLYSSTRSLFERDPISYVMCASAACSSLAIFGAALGASVGLILTVKPGT
mmetsp:Transcript_55194/g.125494  ORF Transcript_55194/g.125494 Transcript_55194/m.125494 type:complete len:847 (+) Transcript_55194:48-2588(+)